MIYAIEGVMLFAALLADFWLGCYGFVPCFAIYVLFHASRSVSLRFATVAALLIGMATDLVYCRGGAVSPLWFTLALYAGCLGGYGRDDEGFGRVWQVIFSGALIGFVLTIYRQVVGVSPASISGAAADLAVGALAGILKLALTVLLLDLVCAYLGVRGFFPPESGSRAGRSLRRRRRRVRAVNVAGRER